MKIVFVTHSASFYGANRSLLTLILGLRSYDIESLVITSSHGQIIDELTKNNIEWKIIPFKTWVRYRWKSKSRLFQSYRNIEHFYKGVRDLIINYFWARVYLKRLKANHPVLIYSNTLLSPFGRILSKLLKVQHIWHVREFLDLDYNLYPDFGFKFLCRILEKGTSIAISNAVANHYFKTNSKSFKVVYNGVINEEDVTLSDSLNKIGDASIFSFSIIGLIHKNKGHEDAIRAIYQLKEDGCKVKLIIFGDGKFELLSDLIEKLNLQNDIEWKGYVGNPEKIYGNSNAVVVCSRFEAFGRVAAEAMAFGVPVIGFANGGTEEIIQDNINGLLYHNNYMELATKMKCLMDDSKLRERIVKYGKKKAKQEFTIEKYVDTIYSILKHQIRDET